MGTFVVIMRRVRSIFIDGLPGFHKLTHYFRKLCVHHLPKLHNKWELLGIDVYKLILTPWLHSLFSYPCLDCGHTARIWDLFLIHDASVLIKIAFTIIASNERKLGKMEFVDIIDFCKFLPCMKFGGKQLIQKSISIKLNEKYLNYTRDLTQFDWQINKLLRNEYIKHQQKRAKKERYKLKTYPMPNAANGHGNTKDKEEQEQEEDHKFDSTDEFSTISTTNVSTFSSPVSMMSTNEELSESIVSVSITMSESSTIYNSNISFTNNT